MQLIMKEFLKLKRIYYTPLHFAVKNGHYDSVEIIYRARGDPLKSNDILFYNLISFQIFRYLYHFNSLFNFTPLDFAQRYGFDDIVALLNTPRAKLQAVSNDRGAETPKSGVPVRDADRSKRSASSNYEKTINELLQLNE